MTLEPNSPIGRIRYVIKTYRDSKSPWVPLDTTYIALYLTGNDRTGDYFDSVMSPLQMFLGSAFGWPPQLHKGRKSVWKEQLLDFFAKVANEKMPWRMLTETRGRDLNEMSVDELLDLAWQEVNSIASQTLPKGHAHDFIIPWIARELGRLSKAVYREDADGSDYWGLVENFANRAPAIAMWAEQENVDLTKTSAAEALEAIKHFDAFSGQMPQGEVVYEFGDGYTLQRLMTEEQINTEGEAMQHCLAEYCVGEDDIAEIYSLRDERGMPHVTMEYEPKSADRPGHFVQIYGKQNSPPVEAYVPYVAEAIEQVFGGDPEGLMMAGIDPRDINFKGKSIYDVVFSGVASGYDGEPFRGADFTGAQLYRCNFADLDLSGAKFSKAEIRSCLFNGSDLTGAEFEKSLLSDVDFPDANLEDTSFADATLRNVDFTGFSDETNLKNVIFDNAQFLFESRLPETYQNVAGASFINSDLSRDNIPIDNTIDASAYAKGLDRVADIKGTPLYEWLHKIELRDFV